MDSTTELIAYYTNHYDEGKRLQADIGPLEFERTKEILSEHLPSAPASILDVGGATGPYSFWLASLGYQVHLVDLVPAHIQQANSAMTAGGPQLASAASADARSLPFGDAIADVVILHGPLYHLPQKSDRLRALREAHRVLRPRSLLLAFAITRYAGLVYGLTKGLIYDPDHLSTYEEELQTGTRGDRPGRPKGFSGYFHLPAEMEGEIGEAGFRVTGSLGILGPAWLVPDLEKDWMDLEKRTSILRAARMTENEPVLGPRFVTVARKAESAV